MFDFLFSADEIDSRYISQQHGPNNIKEKYLVTEPADRGKDILNEPTITPGMDRSV